MTGRHNTPTAGNDAVVPGTGGGRASKGFSEVILSRMCDLSHNRYRIDRIPARVQDGALNT